MVRAPAFAGRQVRLWLILQTLVNPQNQYIQAVFITILHSSITPPTYTAGVDSQAEKRKYYIQ
jgi:hypothetical protein